MLTLVFGIENEVMIKMVVGRLEKTDGNSEGTKWKNPTNVRNEYDNKLTLISKSHQHVGYELDILN